MTVNKKLNIACHIYLSNNAYIESYQLGLIIEGILVIMATKKDITSDTTLELEGDISPNQLIKAVKAFHSLLNGSRKFHSPDKNIHWTVQVKKGCNLVEYSPKGEINSAIIQNVQRDLAQHIEQGLTQLRNGTERPEGFDTDMIRDLRTLCDVSKDKEDSKTSVRLWLNKKSSDVTMTIRSNADNILGNKFEEHGAVEGMLQMLDVHDGKEFAIFESLNRKRIKCTAESDEIFNLAYKLFDKRVEAEGLVKYDALGIPNEITVEHFSVLPQITNPDDYKNTRGILKKYV